MGYCRQRQVILFVLFCFLFAAEIKSTSADEDWDKNDLENDLETVKRIINKHAKLYSEAQRQQITVLNGAYYEVVGELGAGEFGKVYKIKANGTSFYALKVMDKLKLDKSNVGQSEREVSILNGIQCPFIVRFFGEIKDASPCFKGKFASVIRPHEARNLVLELARGGDMEKLIESQNNKKLIESDAKIYFAQLLLALKFFAGIRVAHQDLKPANILLDQNGVIKIADFGLARDTIRKTSYVSGTPTYMAPEAIRSFESHLKGSKVKVAYDPKKVDWWSLGIITYHMVSGVLPFIDMSDYTLEGTFHSILNNDLKFSKEFSTELKDLLSKLLEKDPSKRWGPEKFDEIASHPWLRDIEWTNMYKKPTAPVLNYRNPAPKPLYDEAAKLSNAVLKPIATSSKGEQPAPTARNVVAALREKFEKLNN